MDLNIVLASIILICIFIIICVIAALFLEYKKLNTLNEDIVSLNKQKS